MDISVGDWLDVGAASLRQPGPRRAGGLLVGSQVSPHLVCCCVDVSSLTLRANAGKGWYVIEKAPWAKS